MARHGGKTVKSVTNSLTHLVTDVEGTGGVSKLKQCKQKGIAVVGEDFIFDIVKKSAGSS